MPASVLPRGGEGVMLEHVKTGLALVGLWAIALLGMVGIFKLPAEREDEQ